MRIRRLVRGLALAALALAGPLGSTAAALLVGGASPISHRLAATPAAEPNAAVEREAQMSQRFLDRFAAIDTQGFPEQEAAINEATDVGAAPH